MARRVVDGKATGDEASVINVLLQSAESSGSAIDRFTGNLISVFGAYNNDTWSNRFTQGGDWRPHERIGQNSGEPKSVPNVAIGPSGHTHAIWYEEVGGQHRLYSRRLQ